jgi:hypothetical protein
LQVFRCSSSVSDPRLKSWCRVLAECASASNRTADARTGPPSERVDRRELGVFGKQLQAASIARGSAPTAAQVVLRRHATRIRGTSSRSSSAAAASMMVRLFGQ